MPRVRIPNASLIASADFPILPFLAPRAFADYRTSSRSQASGGKHNVSNKKQEKQSSRLSESSRPENTVYSNAPLINRPVDTRTYSTCHGLVPKSGTRHGVGMIYAGISSFARQYHTQRLPIEDATPTSNDQNAHVRRVKSKKGTQSLWDGLTRRGAHGKNRRVWSHQKPPTTRRGIDLKQKRDKALSLEKSRLVNYVSRLPPGMNPEEYFQSGQYRSLQRRITTLRTWENTKLSLMGPITESSRKSWLINAFSALDRSLYTSIATHTRKLILVHDPRCARLSQRLFSAGHDGKSVATKWMELDLETKRAWVERLTIYILDRKPARALAFIQAITFDAESHKSRAILIADALGHLAKLHHAGHYPTKHHWSGGPEILKQKYIAAFIHVFQHVLAKHRSTCSQDLLYNLTGVAKGEGLKEVLKCLKTARTVFNFDTLLHYANAFAKEGETQSALECLEETKLRHSGQSWAAVVTRERLRWTCALILRESMSDGQGYHDTTAIVARFLNLGIKMDILLYNVIMHNAMEAGDYRTAFKVYNTLESNGLKPDQHTLSILLHGCSAQISPVAFKPFAQHCAEFAREVKDQWLATDYLNYVNRCHQDDADLHHSSAVLWKAYLSLFSGLPLEPFIGHHRASLRHEINEQIHSSTSSIMAPTPLAFFIMLEMEIRLAQAGNVQRLLNLYRQFRVLAQRPELKNFTKEPALWNLFLLAFCKNKQFANASQVIKDMTDTSPQPNVYSWNIFMQGFFKADQIQAAERVYEIMKIRGVTPDQYTYGVLLRGYAKAQSVDKIGEIMQQLDAEQELNPELLQSLAKIDDRAKLMSTLEQSRIRKLAAMKIAAGERLPEEGETMGFLRARGESTTSTAPMDSFLQCTRSFLLDDSSSEPESNVETPPEPERKSTPWTMPLFGQGTSVPSRYKSMLATKSQQQTVTDEKVPGNPLRIAAAQRSAFPAIRPIQKGARSTQQGIKCRPV